MTHHYRFSSLLLAGVLLANTAVCRAAPGDITPFHTEAQSVNSEFYLPPPPGENDPAFTDDKAEYIAGYAKKGTPRWRQATQDANLQVANIAKIFSPVLEVPLSQAKTPATWKMIENLLVVGASYAPGAAKKYYMRTRPFVYYGHHTCQPEDEPALRQDGSYPSGHTTFGTLLGLVLAEAKPDRARELAKRAWEFGQSRVICGAHWQSDVNAGRYVGAVEFAHLQTLPAFLSSLQAVKQELNHSR